MLLIEVTAHNFGKVIKHCIQTF